MKKRLIACCAAMTVVRAISEFDELKFKFEILFLPFFRREVLSSPSSISLASSVTSAGYGKSAERSHLRLDDLQQPQVASHGAIGGMYFSSSYFLLVM